MSYFAAKAAANLPIGGLILQTPIPYLNIRPEAFLGQYFCEMFKGEKLLDLEEALNDVQAKILVIGSEVERFFKMDLTRQVYDAIKTEKEFATIQEQEFEFRSASIMASENGELIGTLIKNFVGEVATKEDNNWISKYQNWSAQMERSFDKIQDKTGYSMM